MADPATKERPTPDEYPEFFSPYLGLVPPGSVLDALQAAAGSFRRILEAVSETDSLHRYAEGKWSIRQVVSHVTDIERVFAFRAWWFARGLPEGLPGVDENSAAATAGADARDLADHLQEFATVRAATCSLLAGLPAEAWTRTGTVGDYRISVRGIAHMIAGHQLHHARILEERYLNG